ncbi:MAG: hypothetical protein P8I80_05480 [Bacteroidales bacterium]|nr:hypothetical protein [Bacteroidales bacterium]
MKNNQIFVLLFIYVIIATLTIIFFDGTGDSGDSIHHYQFAKLAPLHPELFFNHWAKPLYVLLASPFAQFTFIGVKIFNSIVSLLTIFFTFKIAQKLNINNAIIGAIILIFSPLCFVLTFSGLTEPLFALFISIGLYTILVKKPIISCLLISFLPFIRSEGLIIIGVFGLYFLLKRKWKLIPFLLFGHIVYSIAGFFVFNDLLWVFNKIPYARMSSTYGSGELSHFVTQLMYVIGVPIYILFWSGVLIIIWKSIKNRISIEIQILVFLGFFSFFIAHSLFWYLGIFNSMGLNRVIIGVAPLISIISLIGFNFLTDEIFKNKRIPNLIFQGLLIGYILIFPFTSNPAAINWERDLSLSKDQQSANQIADLISHNRGSNQRFVFAHPYLSEVLKIDHFDDTKRLELTADFMNHIKSGDIVIWENWFAVVEHGVTKEYLDTNTELTCLHNISVWDQGREILYSVYQIK